MTERKLDNVPPHLMTGATAMPGPRPPVDDPLARWTDAGLAGREAERNLDAATAAVRHAEHELADATIRAAELAREEGVVQTAWMEASSRATEADKLVVELVGKVTAARRELDVAAERAR